MKQLNILILFIALSIFAFGQSVTNQKEAEKLYRQSKIDAKYNKLYFDLDHECRDLMREKDFYTSLQVCQKALLAVEKLPKDRLMERHSANVAFGVSLLRNEKATDSIVYFNKALAVSKSILDDTDSETGEVYFFLSQANHLLGEEQKAIDFCIKAEKAYRAAFIKIDDDEIRDIYPKRIKMIIEAHILLLENIERTEEATKIKLRLEEFKKEFAKYL
jgi:tetratricopeptide (TPR) repeat protein